MRIQKCQSLNFKAKVDVEKESGCTNPAIDKFVEFLKTLGGEDVTHQVTAQDHFVYCISTKGDNVARLSVKGNKARTLDVLKKMVINQTTERGLALI